MSLNLIPTKEITIENTTYCGANCIVCPRSKYSSNWEHMNTDFFMEIMDQAAELGVISLDTCGFGDSFMDPEFEKKLRLTKERYPFVKTYNSTTGHLCDENRYQWIIETIDTLKISIYATSKETYGKIHGEKLNFEKIKKNINRIIETEKSKRPYIIMLFVVLPENRHEAEQWKEEWESKSDEIMLWKPHNWNGTYPSDSVTPLAIQSCGRPLHGNPYVHANGEVSICCFDYNKNLIIGDLRKEKLKDILQGEKLERIRSMHKDLTFPENIICKKCDQTSDRSGALVYSSNTHRNAGIITTHPDLINNML
ncbi:MAG: SPASM domain-containing protein [Oligoflexia bacterium]|nr:SPASM domain-containing protein [Oligoflexia bacterium]